MSLSAATVADDNTPVTACFSVHAHAEPGVMPRHSLRCGTDEGELAIEIQMRGLGRELTDYLAACLRQIAYVEVVLTSEKSSAPG